jgi:hypothetical protein
MIMDLKEYTTYHVIIGRNLSAERGSPPMYLLELREQIVFKFGISISYNSCPIRAFNQSVGPNEIGILYFKGGGEAVAVGPWILET